MGGGGTALTGTATFIVLLRMETSKCETQEKESRLPKLRPPTVTVSSDQVILFNQITETHYIK